MTFDMGVGMLAATIGMALNALALVAAVYEKRYWHAGAAALLGSVLVVQAVMLLAGRP